MHLLADLSGWLGGQDLTAEDLTMQKAEEFLRDRRRRGCRIGLSPRAIAPILGYLRNLQVTPPPVRPVPVTPQEILLASYRDYLSGERGVSAGTVTHYLRCARPLLEHNHHLIRTGQILLADKGFAGQGFKQLTDAMGLRLLRPDRKDETYRNGDLGGVRQWIESVNQASSTSKPTAPEPLPESSPASPSASWPWPPGSGTTGPPAPSANNH